MKSLAHDAIASDNPKWNTPAQRCPPSGENLSAYLEVLRQRGEQGEKYVWQMQRVLSGFNIQDARVLDIGAGWGRHSLYFSAMGASEVVALEPELAGSSSGMVERFQNSISQFGFKNIVLQNVDFESASLVDGHFDLIFTHAVINHLCETREVIRAKTREESCYLKYFERMHSLLKPGGILMVIDAHRANIGRLLNLWGWKNRFNPNIDWRLHQRPRTWIRLMSHVGFRAFRWQYHVPFCFRHCAWIWNNPVTDFLTYGMFYLRAQK